MAPPTAHLLLAAPIQAPGAGPLLERATAAGCRGLHVLLAGPGLAWAARVAALRARGADVAVCSQDARAAGWRLEEAPAGVRWASVGTWLAELPADAPLWVALP